jgi:radical SAM superfamily enzyme YgiQ (UPF0313 family)
LRTARKGTSPEVNARARRLCREFGIRFKAFVIAGLPGETPETIRKTRDWLITNEVDDLTVTMFVAFPGSDIWERPENYEIACERDYEREPWTFRGRSGLGLPRLTQTPGLSAEELAEIPERMEAEVRRARGIAGNYQGAGKAAA